MARIEQVDERAEAATEARHERQRQHLQARDEGAGEEVEEAVGHVSRGYSRRPGRMNHRDAMDTEKTKHWLAINFWSLNRDQTAGGVAQVVAAEFPSH